MTCRSIRHEPRWRPVRLYTSAQLPPENRHWLLDDGSLTNRLVAQGRGNFRVQRLFQGWCEPLLSERCLLGLACRRTALVREVLLLVAEHPVVFARSVFPVDSLCGGLRHLRKLQNRSLGSILFQHPHMRRSPFELALIPGSSDYLPRALQQPGPAWGRRSRFVVEGRPLMVSEIFLQDFRPWESVLPVHRSQRGRIDPENLPAKQ